jgi:hypothetical protein
MVNTHGGYRESGEGVLHGLERSIKPKIVGTSHEDHDKEDLEVSFTSLEQIIVALIEMVIRLLVMKCKKGHLAKFRDEEEKIDPEDSKSEKRGDFSNNNSLPSS